MLQEFLISELRDSVMCSPSAPAGYLLLAESLSLTALKSCVLFLAYARLYNYCYFCIGKMKILTPPGLVGGLCDYRVSSLVKTKSLTMLKLISVSSNQGKRNWVETCLICKQLEADKQVWLNCCQLSVWLHHTEWIEISPLL